MGFWAVSKKDAGWMKGFFLVSIAASAFCCASVSSVGQVNVLTYHNNNARTGENLNETILTPANVQPATFGKLFAYSVDGHIYAQPLYVSGLNIPGKGTHNVVFVATQHNSVYAFDADSDAGADGGLLWQVNFGPSAATPNPDFGNRFGGFTEISPEVGITSTPVIDLASGTMYLDAFTHEGTNYFHRIHALNISDGSERSFSPALVQATYPGHGVGSAAGSVIFDPKQQLQRSALTLAGGVLYLAFASYAITDPYHGWVVGFDSQSLRRIPSFVFNTTPNSTVADFGPHAGEGGIWMGGGGLCAEGNNLYFAVGNGYFDAFTNSTGNDYGDCLIRLSTVGGLSVADYFAPFNHRSLADNDLDLGSGGVVLLPDQPGPVPRLMVCSGKPGKLYLVNRDQMTSDNAHVNNTADLVLQSFLLPSGTASTPAWFNNRLYIVPSGKEMISLTLTNGLFDTNSISAGKRTYKFPGATPSISADGTRNGIVWALKRDTSAVLSAYDAADVSQEIYSSDSARDRLPEGVKFAVPTVANGKVYVGTKGGLFVFGLVDSNTGDGGNPTNVPPGGYNGLFFESSGAELGRSGSFTVRVTSRAAYTGVLRTSTARLSFKGKFDTSGVGTNILQLRGSPPLTLAFQPGPDDSSQLTGTVSGDGWSADLIAHRAVTGAPRPFAGKYTLIFPGGTNGDSQFPQGDGYAIATVSSKGSVKLAGALPDGTKLTQAATLSDGGDWPFYVFQSRGPQQVIGFLNATAITQGNGGQLAWTKSPSSSHFYPDGFSVQMNLLGSVFSRPSGNASVLGFNDGMITLTGGDLSSDLSSSITIGVNNRITSDSDLRLSVNKTSGLFTGTVTNPDTGRRIKFSGALLQDQNIGSGFFLGTDQSGRVSVEAQ